MDRLLTFTSTAFPVEPGEDRQTNPGLYGKALAHWLREQLTARGVTTEGVIPEDFGWLVMISHQPCLLWVGCCSEDDSHSQWRVFVAAEPSLLQRLFRKVDPRPRVAEIEQHLEAILHAHPGVQDLQWE